MELLTAFELLTKLGAIFTMAVAIWGGKQEWYLWKGSHDKIVQAIEDGHADTIRTMQHELEELREDRNYWRSNAVETLNAARRALQLADREPG